jgi:transposase-like protein
MTEEPEYRDESTLRELYVEQDLTTTEIGNRYGVCSKTISNWLNRHNIRTGGKGSGKPYDVSLYTSERGYVRVENEHEGERDRFAIHRLVAVAEEGFAAVRDMEVHHKNNIRWHNCSSNLQVISPEKHGRLHANERWEQHS